MGKNNSCFFSLEISILQNSLDSETKSPLVQFPIFEIAHDLNLGFI